eukprot:s1673_g17.t1
MVSDYSERIIAWLSWVASPDSQIGPVKSVEGSTALRYKKNQFGGAMLWVRIIIFDVPAAISWVATGQHTGGDEPVDSEVSESESPTHDPLVATAAPVSYGSGAAASCSQRPIGVQRIMDDFTAILK